MKHLNVFETKARVVLAFDPDHLQKLDAGQIARVVEIAGELTRIPGFRGCLPCAASGLDEFAYMSHVLPALTQQKG
jgi:hypothetical protein